MRCFYTILSGLALAVLLTLALAVSPPSARAQEKKVRIGDAGPSGLAVPRFESLAANRVNLRAGPGSQYPIVWVFVKKNLPVMVLAEFQYWRKVRDADGAEGWVHKTLIRGRRTALITGGIRNMHSEPDLDSDLVARLEAGVLAQLTACNAAWCQLAVNNYSGWVRRKDFFGALPEEIFE